MKIFITQGEHPFVPGTPLTAHTTHGGAADAAVALVQIIADDVRRVNEMDLPATVTAENWESVLEQVQEYHGAQTCAVWIVETELI